MKKGFIRTLVVVAVLLLTPVLSFAQEKDTITSSAFQVQNLGTEDTTVTVKYYNADGTEAASQQKVVRAQSSVTFLPFDVTETDSFVTMAAPEGFIGGVVIESDSPIVAITNLTGDARGSSYPGFEMGAEQINLPLIARNNGFSTSFSVQNAGTAAATVNISYAGANPNTGDAVTASEDAFTLQPGAARQFYQVDKTELGEVFVGAGTVSSSGNQLVVAVTQEGNNQLLTYDGFTAGSNTVAVPLLMAHNYGSYTGLQIQNAGTNSTNVTVSYSPNAATQAPDGYTVCANAPQDVVVNDLAAGASVTLLQLEGEANNTPSILFEDEFEGCTYVGGATVTSSGEPLVAIINQVDETGKKQASAYEGFNPANATQRIEAPVVFAQNTNSNGNATLFSAIQVQNTGSADTTVTVTYSPNSATGEGACTGVTSAQKDITAGNSDYIFQSTALDPSNFPDGCTYVGSATIEAGQNIVAIVNQTDSDSTLANTDVLFTYNGFNRTTQ